MCEIYLFEYRPHRCLWLVISLWHQLLLVNPVYFWIHSHWPLTPFTLMETLTWLNPFKSIILKRKVIELVCPWSHESWPPPFSSVFHPHSLSCVIFSQGSGDWTSSSCWCSFANIGTKRSSPIENRCSLSMANCSQPPLSSFVTCQ